MTTLSDARTALIDLGHLLCSASQHAAPLVLDSARCAALAQHLNTALALGPNRDPLTAPGGAYPEEVVIDRPDYVMAVAGPHPRHGTIGIIERTPGHPAITTEAWYAADDVPALARGLARHLTPLQQLAAAPAIVPLITSLLDDAGCAHYHEELGGTCREREPDGDVALGIDDEPPCAHCQLSALLERAP
jgi:hypothetical protein